MIRTIIFFILAILIIDIVWDNSDTTTRIETHLCATAKNPVYLSCVKNTNGVIRIIKKAINESM